MKLLHKKLIWTAGSTCILYKTWWAYNWQMERKIWKQDLIKDRTAKLAHKPIKVTVDEIPHDKMSKEEFDDKWLYKPLIVSGIFDHSQETQVARTRNDDRGFEIITPLYTKVDQKSGALSGILVNRGRIPVEYKESKMHLTPPNQEHEVEGVLMYSEHDDKQTVNN